MRFPEFSGEWETRKLGEVAIIGRGKSRHRPRDADHLFGGQYPFIQTGDIRKADLYLTEFTQTYSEAGLEQSKLWNENTLCITIAANIAETAILKIKACFPDSVIGLIPKEDKTIVLFVKYLFDKSKIEIQKLSQGVAQDNLNQEKLSKIEFFFPELVEQKKNSHFLYLIDERIATQNKIIEGLKLSKKILIKKIFNQQLSFDGRHNNNFPDWEEKKIKELFSFKITNSFSREQLNHKNGKVKNIHYGDIHTRFQTLFDIEKEEVPYINTDVNINKINEENYCAIGDMVFADASEDLIDVGKSIEIVKLNNQKLLAGLHTILARPISNTFSIGFCGYLFKSDRIRTQIQKESQGSKVLSISAVRLSNISFSIPCIEEQIKITNFLSSIDSKIDIETRFLQKLEQQKKFLLQNLFV